jgi:hypothetical protein
MEISVQIYTLTSLFQIKEASSTNLPWLCVGSQKSPGNSREEKSIYPCKDSNPDSSMVKIVA